MTETWLSAIGDVAKTVTLASRGFDVKSFQRQSRYRGGGITTVSNYTLGSNITFKTKLDFTHTSFEVVLASITIYRNNTFFFLCTALHQADETTLLTLCFLNSCLTVLIS